MESLQKEHPKAPRFWGTAPLFPLLVFVRALHIFLVFSGFLAFGLPLKHTQNGEVSSKGLFFFCAAPRRGYAYRRAISGPATNQETRISGYTGDSCSVTVDYVRNRWYWHRDRGGWIFFTEKHGGACDRRFCVEGAGDGRGWHGATKRGAGGDA